MPFSEIWKLAERIQTDPIQTDYIRQSDPFDANE